MNGDLSAKILADAKAMGFKPISGTTDIECPECGGRKTVYTEEIQIKPYLKALPTKCPKCENGVIPYKWKVSVVLENGELPSCNNHVFGIVNEQGMKAQKDMLSAKYKQVVE